MDLGVESRKWEMPSSEKVTSNASGKNVSGGDGMCSGSVGICSMRSRIVPVWSLVAPGRPCECHSLVG